MDNVFIGAGLIVIGLLSFGASIWLLLKIAIGVLNAYEDYEIISDRVKKLKERVRNDAKN